MKDMAAPRPSWKACIWLAMRGAIMTLVDPPTRSGTKNIPTRGTKVSAAAETTPGTVWGRVTCQKARSGRAPRSPAASSSAQSIFSSDE